MREAIQELIDYLEKRIPALDAEGRDYYNLGNYSASSFKDGMSVSYRFVVYFLSDILDNHQDETEGR